MTEKFCPGFLTAGIHAGLKSDNKEDLGLIYSEIPVACAGVFTKNLIKAAPLLIDMERIKSGYCHALIVNSKNANCCTGEEGMAHARAMTKSVAVRLGIDEELVLAASTGVIGERFPIEKIDAAIPELVKSLNDSDGKAFARAIMTTDTIPKIVSVRRKVGDSFFTISGVAKGSGMIHPDMATMLCFICTDIKATPRKLYDILTVASDKSLNRVTIDGDTSTNDMALLFANSVSKLSIEDSSVEKAFEEGIEEVMITLAKMIARDGEGATKLVEVRVTGAATKEDALKIANTIACSPLVKTAIFGEDANWGRIIAAAGRAGVLFDPANVSLFFDNAMIMENGRPRGAEAVKKTDEIMKKEEFLIRLDIGAGGEYEESVYTCDFSIEYVKINAEYRT